MTNQAGSANWTCPNCGAMASVLDTKCPHCKTARGSVTTQPLSVTAGNQTAPAASNGAAAWEAVRTGGGSAWRRLEAWLDAAPQPRDGTPRSRGVAIALALFAGFIGAQQFYMGRRVLGVLSVLFCWTAWPAAVGMMDAARMLFMTEQEFRRACR